MYTFLFMLTCKMPDICEMVTQYLSLASKNVTSLSTQLTISQCKYQQGQWHLQSQKLGLLCF